MRTGWCLNRKPFYTNLQCKMVQGSRALRGCKSSRVPNNCQSSFLDMAEIINCQSNLPRLSEQFFGHGRNRQLSEQPTSIVRVVFWTWSKSSNVRVVLPIVRVVSWTWSKSSNVRVVFQLSEQFFDCQSSFFRLSEQFFPIVKCQTSLPQLSEQFFDCQSSFLDIAKVSSQQSRPVLYRLLKQLSFSC